MVFVAGPRQVGKTYLAKNLPIAKNKLYYNWDNREQRRTVLAAKWPIDPTLIILDEIHKYHTWKRWLKGEYDVHKDLHSFLVTGSARLDIYRKGGDSLQGRYHQYRLHPFTVCELLHKNTISSIKPGDDLSGYFAQSTAEAQDIFHSLLQFGGFPEPFLSQSESIRRRWHKERLERFFREDVRDLERIPELSKIELLADLLPEKIGGLLSINSLREDLEVSHKAVTNWLSILERLFMVYRVPPFQDKKIRSIKKEQKCYFWDWSMVESKGARLENLVASHILKFCNYLEDTEGYAMGLYFLRDLEKREVDFLVTYNKKPWFAVEVKSGDSEASKNLLFLGKKLQIPYLFQLTQDGTKEYRKDNFMLCKASKFLSIVG